MMTLGGKITQPTSLKTSKVSFNQDLKIQPRPNEVKQSWMTTKNTARVLPTQQAKHTPQPSIALISDISFVEEEFISQGSETLQVLNFINPLKQDSKNNGHPSYYQSENFKRDTKDIGNIRKIEFKSKLNSTNKKKLLL